MNKLNLTATGGFPFDQNQYDWLQQGNIQVFNALGNMGNNSAPVIVSGMVNDGTNVSDGVLFWNNDYIPFIGGAIGATIAISTYNTTLVYNDGSSHSSKTRTAAAFGTGAVQFNYSDLKLYQEGFGLKARSGWIDAAPPTGTCIYMLNKLTNMVHVRGTFPHLQNLNGGFSPARPMQMPHVALPYAPPATVYFRTNIETHIQVEIYTDGGTLYTGEVGRIDVSGNISISSRKLGVGYPSPTHNYYFSFQL